MPMLQSEGNSNGVSFPQTKVGKILSPSRGRASRHGAIARRATAHWQMTIGGMAADPERNIKACGSAVMRRECPLGSDRLTRTACVRHSRGPE